MKRPTITILGTAQCIDIEAKWDSGADRSAMDYKTAAKIGAGPVVKSVKTNQVSGSERRPVVPVWFDIDGHHQRVKVGLSDRENMSTAVLLGNDVLDYAFGYHPPLRYEPGVVLAAATVALSVLAVWLAARAFPRLDETAR